MNDTANLLDIPKSTISRRLKALEEELSVKLFHRHGRELVITAAGNHFYQKTQRMMTELEQTISDITSKEASLIGSLRIQVLPIPRIRFIFNTIYKFMDLHPNLKIELYTTAEPVDMIRNNIDVAFRIDEQLEDVDLVARPLFTAKLHFVASPKYLATNGYPKTAADISNHNCIIYRFLNSKIIDEIPEFDNGAGVKLKGNLYTSSLSFSKEAAIYGKGIAMLPSEFVKAEVENGSLIKLLPDVEPYEGSYNIVYPSRSFLSLAASRFIDYIMEENKHQQSTEVSDDFIHDYWQ